MAELQQSPEVAQNAAFLHTASAFKILKTGTATLTLPASLASQGTTTTTVAHGLIIAPAFLAFAVGGTSSIVANNTYLNLPIVSYLISAGVFQGVFILSGWTDNTNLNFAVQNGFVSALAAPGTILIKYYLLAESAT